MEPMFSAWRLCLTGILLGKISGGLRMVWTANNLFGLMTVQWMFTETIRRLIDCDGFVGTFGENRVC
ncbi:MAG: hypothetical protein IKC51_05130 [Myxococcaceae bacterium]|nr:hypothetical protein [Myxococcaceae bacterium]